LGGEVVEGGEVVDSQSREDGQVNRIMRVQEDIVPLSVRGEYRLFCLPLLSQLTPQKGELLAVPPRKVDEEGFAVARQQILPVILGQDL
jgi:hypothetical protein